MVSKKIKKIIILFFFYFSLFGKNGHGIGKKVAIFNWEWGPNSAPRDGQKIPCLVILTCFFLIPQLIVLGENITIYRGCEGQIENSVSSVEQFGSRSKQTECWS